MTSPDSLDLTVLERILHTAASASAIDALCREQHYKARRGIYSLVVVIWLMIYQRLNSKGTWSSAVPFLARQAAHGKGCAEVGKRVREGRISTPTGGYGQARLRWPTLVASSVCEHIFGQLQVLMREPLPEMPRPVFVIDGTTLRLPHRRELVKAFPPGRNQHGENHWPTMVMVAFHDAQTGLAAQPSWGPMYGKKAIREQDLARDALPKLPAHAIVVADIHLGIWRSHMRCNQPNAPCYFG